jgi:hypothetical protein
MKIEPFLPFTYLEGGRFTFTKMVVGFITLNCSDASTPDLSTTEVAPVKFVPERTTFVSPMATDGLTSVTVGNWPKTTVISSVKARINGIFFIVKLKF